MARGEKVTGGDSAPVVENVDSNVLTALTLCKSEPNAVTSSVPYSFRDAFRCCCSPRKGLPVLAEEKAEPEIPCGLFLSFAPATTTPSWPISFLSLFL